MLHQYHFGPMISKQDGLLWNFLEATSHRHFGALMSKARLWLYRYKLVHECDAKYKYWGIRVKAKRFMHESKIKLLPWKLR